MKNLIATDQIEYTENTARFPPQLAQSRYARLRENRRLGIGPHIAPRRERTPKPDIPITLRIDKKDREKIPFEVKAGISNERRAFFESDVDVEYGEEIDWNAMEMAESIPGLEVGRVVECRRYVYISQVEYNSHLQIR